MAYTIGIITAESSLELIRDNIGDEIDSQWQVEFLPYAVDRHLPELYTGNLRRFDGLVFSGNFNYEYIKRTVGAVGKPHVVFDLTDRDYYKVFARLLYRHPGADIRRVLMETPSAGIDLQDLFDGAAPTWLDADVYQADSIAEIYQMVMEYALRLWRENKIDRVITRFTNLVAPLRERGIPTERLSPSKTTMLERFRDLCGQIQSRQLANTLTAFGILDCSWDASRSMDILSKLLEEFNLRLGMPLVIHREGDSFEIATSNETLMEITQEYSNCLLTLFLQERLPESAVSLGWGVGRDIASASKNAAAALAEARRSRGRRAYLVNENRELVGPLAAGQSMSMEHQPSPEAEEIGRALGISPRNLQTLINLQEKRGVRLFSSGDLAYYLNITPRSANRILSKLVQHGGARIAHSAQPVARGRPSNIYQVDWRELKAATMAKRSDDPASE